jgi:hypothetical protein
MDKKTKNLVSEMVDVIDGLLEYIDAIPDELEEQFPAMPGVDRDWAEETLHDAKALLKNCNCNQWDNSPGVSFCPIHGHENKYRNTPMRDGD